MGVVGRALRRGERQRELGGAERCDRLALVPRRIVIMRRTAGEGDPGGATCLGDDGVIAPLLRLTPEAEDIDGSIRRERAHGQHVGPDGHTRGRSPSGSSPGFDIVAVGDEELIESTARPSDGRDPLVPEGIDDPTRHLTMTTQEVIERRECVQRPRNRSDHEAVLAPSPTGHEDRRPAQNTGPGSQRDHRQLSLEQFRGEPGQQCDRGPAPSGRLHIDDLHAAGRSDARCRLGRTRGAGTRASYRTVDRPPRPFTGPGPTPSSAPSSPGNHPRRRRSRRTPERSIPPLAPCSRTAWRW